jgi:hypothetical protein
MSKLQFQLIMKCLLYILYAHAFPNDNNTHIRNYWKLYDECIRMEIEHD